MRLRNGIEAHKAKLLDRVVNQLTGTLDAKAIDQIRNVKLPWYVVKNAITEDDEGEETAPSTPDEDEEPEAEILIYSEIGGSLGVSADEFVADLNAITNKRIAVRINSPGGSVFDSIAIYNALVKKSGQGHEITTYVDALAASGASIIAMGGDSVCMMVGSQLMIHDAMGVEMGNARDMQAMATFLDRQSDNIASIYSNKAGGTNEEWRARMLDETWMFANEAVEAGLADRVYIKPKQKTEGEPVEAEVEDEEESEEDTNPDFPAPDEDEESTEDKETDAILENLMKATHNLKPFNYRYKGRRNAPAPSIPDQHDEDALINSLQSAFGKA